MAWCGGWQTCSVDGIPAVTPHANWGGWQQLLASCPRRRPAQPRQAALLALLRLRPAPALTQGHTWPHSRPPAPCCTAQALTYRLAEGNSLEDLEERDRYYLSDEYKRTVLQHMSVPQLIDTILINPTVNISPSYRDTGGWVLGSGCRLPNSGWAVVAAGMKGLKGLGAPGPPEVVPPLYPWDK